MKSASRSARTPSQFSSALQQNLNAYALSAAAAGVAVLAVHPRADAEVIYTPADIRIANGARLELDLDHDGVADFKLINDLHLSTTPFGDDLSIKGAVKGNEISESNPKRFYYFANALASGVQVGPGASFRPHPANMAYASLTAFTYVSGGPWKNATNRYLGLKFLINGEVHYGWARLTVSARKHQEEVHAVLTGYAYETVANQPIMTGQTAENRASASHADSPAFFQLGLLALGMDGLALWRSDQN